jgi:hypothetical protein
MTIKELYVVNINDEQNWAKYATLWQATYNRTIARHRKTNTHILRTSS